MTISRTAQTRILVAQYSSNRDGSALSCLSLANGFLDRGWSTMVVFGYQGPIEDVFQQAGHETRVIPHKNWLRRSHPLRFIKDVVKEWRKSREFESLIRQFSPDVVYVNTAVSLAAVVAAWRHDVPVAWHLRELFADAGGEMKAPRVGKWFARLLFTRLSDVLIVNSQAVAQNMLGKKPSRKPWVVPNAVSKDYFSQITPEEARSEFGLPLNSIVVGVPGTLRPMKGHPFFFRSVVRLIEERSELVLAVTGDGEKMYVRELQVLAENLGIASRTQFLGKLNGLTRFYRACDIICIPSRAEPFGRVIIEAFAAGIPVVATAVGGIPEIIIHNVNGMLVPYGDEPALASAIERLLVDQDLCQQLAHNAREKAMSTYVEEHYQERISYLIESLNAEKAG